MMNVTLKVLRTSFLVLLYALELEVSVAENVAPVTSLTPNQMREDLTFLRDAWGKVDRSLNAAERKEFDVLVADAMRKSDTLSPAQFSLIVSRAVALAHNGHTSSSLGLFFHRLPLRLHWFADGLYVVRAPALYSELLGARVESFGGLLPDEALGRVRKYISGTDDRAKELSGDYLGLLEVLQEIGASNTSESATLGFKLPDGSKREVTLHASVAPDPAPTARTSWGSLLQSDRAVAERWQTVLDSLNSIPVAFSQSPM